MSGVEKKKDDNVVYPLRIKLCYRASVADADGKAVSERDYVNQVYADYEYCLIT